MSKPVTMMQFKLSDMCPDSDDVLAFLAEAAMHHGVDRIGLMSDKRDPRPKKRKSAAAVESVDDDSSCASAKKPRTMKHSLIPPTAAARRSKQQGSRSSPLLVDQSLIPGLSAVPLDIGGHKTQGCVVLGMQQPIAAMADSTHLFSSGDHKRLYEAFDRDSYVLVRNVVETDLVARARVAVLDVLFGAGALSCEGRALARKGWTIDTASGAVIEGSKMYASEQKKDSTWESIPTEDSIERLKESAGLRNVFRALAAGKELVDETHVAPRRFSPQFSWLRVKAPGELTPEHSDTFYFLNNTTMFDRETGPEQVETMFCSACQCGDAENELILCDECNRCLHIRCLSPPLLEIPKEDWYCPDCAQRPLLVSCWTPLGDVAVNDGVLCVLGGSHTLPRWNVGEKSRTQIPASYREHGKHLTWMTTDFRSGDVVLFNSRAVHCTSKNCADTFRLSIDTRWILSPQDRLNFGKTAPSKFIIENTIDETDVRQESSSGDRESCPVVLSSDEDFNCSKEFHSLPPASHTPIGSESKDTPTEEEMQDAQASLPASPPPMVPLPMIPTETAEQSSAME